LRVFWPVRATEVGRVARVFTEPVGVEGPQQGNCGRWAGEQMAVMIFIHRGIVRWRCEVAL